MFIPAFTTLKLEKSGEKMSNYWLEDKKSAATSLPCQEAMHKAAQAWCGKTTSNKEMDVELALVFARILEETTNEIHVQADKEIRKLQRGLEMAWGIIANAYGGNWHRASEVSGWKKAAERWRDEVWAPVAHPER
jgi:hypothetical protein